MSLKSLFVFIYCILLLSIDAYCIDSLGVEAIPNVNKQDDSYGQVIYTNAVHYTLLKSLFIGAFAAILGFSLVMYRYSWHARYKWYATFQFCLLFYFWQDFTWFNTIPHVFSPIFWPGEYKSVIIVLIYCCYLKFIQYFIDEENGLRWLHTFIKRFIFTLLLYTILELVVIYWFKWESTRLIVPRMLAFSPGLWLVYKVWKLPGISVRYFRWASIVLIIAFCITSILKLVLPAQSSWHGLDYSLLPSYLGLLIESSIFLVAISSQEKIWIKEQILALSLENENKSKQLLREQRLVQEKDKKLKSIQQELDQAFELNKVITLKNYEQEKIKKDLEFENELLRSRFDPTVLEQIQQNILYSIQAGNKEKATDKLRSFAILMRDTIYFLRQAHIPLQEELKLCQHYCKLFDNEFVSPSIPVHTQGLCIPPMSLLNIIQYILLHKKNNTLNFKLFTSKETCRIEIQGSVFSEEFFQLCKDQFERFNQKYGTNYLINHPELQLLVVRFYSPVIDNSDSFMAFS